jgi:hypothetical protein
MADVFLVRLLLPPVICQVILEDNSHLPPISFQIHHLLPSFHSALYNLFYLEIISI